MGRKLNGTAFPVAFALLLAIGCSALAGPIEENLVIHLDAGLGVVQNTGGVAQWWDQAPRGGIQEAQMSDENRRPDLVANAVNNRPAIRFDGSDDSLLILDNVSPALLDGNNTVSWFAVYKETDAAGTVLRTRYDGTSGSTTLWGTFKSSGNGNTYSHSRASTGLMKGQQNPSSSDFAVLGAVWDGASFDQSVRQWINGTQGIPHSSGDTGANNPATTFNRLRIGQDANGGSPSTIDMAEILVYDKALTASERNQVGYYLQQKYGLSGAYTPTSQRARWRLDEPPGATTAADSVSINHGTVSGATSGQPGPGGGSAYSFNGTSDHVDLSSHAANFAGLDEGTIVGWFKTTGTGTHVILGASDRGDGSSELRLIVEGSRLRYDVRDGSSNPPGESGNVQSPTDVNDGTWHHAAVVVDTHCDAMLYVDGRTVAGAQEPFFTGVRDLDQMAIGRNVDSGGAQWHFSGSLSDVAVYDRPLTIGQINDVMQRGASASPQNLHVAQAHWEFNDKAPGGTTVNTERIADSSGNGRDAFAGGGTITPGFVKGDPRYSYGTPTALRFSAGNRDSVIFRDAFGFGDGGPDAGPDIDFGQVDSFTIEALLRTTSTSLGGIVAKDYAGDQPSWWLRMQTNGTLQAIVDDRNSPDPNVNGLVNGMTAINDGEWHHIAFVRDAENDVVQLFIDYAQDAWDVDDTLLTSFSTRDIRIGESNGGGWQFDGDIDFVRITSGALSPEDFVQPTPEPATFVLLGLGALALARRRGRQTTRRQP